MMNHKISGLSLLSFILFFATSGISQMLEPMAYSDGGQKFKALLGLPKTTDKKKAGILILPAWMGIDENAKGSAKKLTAMGYYSLVADIYGEGNYPTDYNKARELSSYYKNNVNEYRKRIALALAQLVKAGADPGNIVVIGYCFGGTGAIEAARANLQIKGAVSFHGGLARDTTKNVDVIIPKVLVCHGAADPFIPESQVKAFHKEMDQAKADWQMNWYAGAVHGFTDLAAGNDPSKGMAYNQKAAERSWAALMDFLAEMTN